MERAQWRGRLYPVIWGGLLMAMAGAQSRARAGEAQGEPKALERNAFVAMVLRRHPELEALRQRAKAESQGVRAEDALPAPELGVEIWNLPLARPYAFRDADMYMAELRQTFPAPGTRAALARARRHEGRAALAEARLRASVLAKEAAEAYADYAHALRDHQTHREHGALLEGMRMVARSRYVTAGSSLADLAKLEVELARVQQALLRAEGEGKRAQAAMNLMLGRPAAAVLALPAEGLSRTIRLSDEALLQGALRHRGDLQAAQHMARAAQARAQGQSFAARRPEFMVGLGYWQMPQMRAGMGVKASMSLPWLWGRARAEARMGEALAQAAEDDRHAVARQIRIEIGVVCARIAALEREWQRLQTSTLPAAKRAVEALQSSYVTGRSSLLEWLDAARVVLETRMEATDLEAEIAREIALLEQATGRLLPRVELRAEEAP